MPYNVHQARPRAKQLPPPASALSAPPPPFLSRMLMPVQTNAAVGLPAADLSGGCVCCGKAEDLRGSLAQLAGAPGGAPDYLVGPGTDSVGWTPTLLPCRPALLRQTAPACAAQAARARAGVACPGPRLSCSLPLPCGFEPWTSAGHAPPPPGHHGRWWRRLAWPTRGRWHRCWWSAGSGSMPSWRLWMPRPGRTRSSSRWRSCRQVVQGGRVDGAAQAVERGRKRACVHCVYAGVCCGWVGRGRHRREAAELAGRRYEGGRECIGGSGAAEAPCTVGLGPLRALTDRPPPPPPLGFSGRGCREGPSSRTHASPRTHAWRCAERPVVRLGLCGRGHERTPLHPRSPTHLGPAHQHPHPSPPALPAPLRGPPPLENTHRSAARTWCC